MLVVMKKVLNSSTLSGLVVLLLALGQQISSIVIHVQPFQGLEIRT